METPELVARRRAAGRDGAQPRSTAAWRSWTSRRGRSPGCRPGQACQITWVPGRTRSCGWRPGGHGGTQIVTGGPGRPRGRLHGPSGRVQSRVLPAGLERRALARLGRGGERARARSRRLRDLRLADRPSGRARPSASPTTPGTISGRTSTCPGRLAAPAARRRAGGTHALAHRADVPARRQRPPAVAWLLSYPLEPYVDRGDFPLFLGAVMLSAWYGGLGPGLLTTVVGAFVGVQGARGSGGRQRPAERGGDHPSRRVRAGGAGHLRRVAAPSAARSPAPRPWRPASRARAGRSRRPRTRSGPCSA